MVVFMAISEQDHGLSIGTLLTSGMLETSLNKLDRLKPRVEKEPRLYIKAGTATYYIDFIDYDGKRRRISTKTIDKAKASRLFNNWLREFKANRFDYVQESDIVTLSVFVDEFLSSRIPPRIAEKTHKLYSEALTKAIDAWGANLDMECLTSRHLDRYISYLVKTGIKIPTVNKNYRHVKAAVRQAIKWLYTPPIVDWPKELKEKKIARYMTKDQLQSYFKAAQKIDSEWFDFCILTCYTGLRSGEALRLTRGDIDNPKGFLRITPEQKNKDESRIPINDMARTIFNRYRDRKDKIFNFSSVYFVSHKFKQTLKKAMLPETFRFHDLRHTYASHMAMAGEDLLTIKELMRHKSISSTMVYTKLSPGHLKDASNRIDYGLDLDSDNE